MQASADDPMAGDVKDAEHKERATAEDKTPMAARPPHGLATRRPARPTERPRAT